MALAAPRAHTRQNMPSSSWSSRPHLPNSPFQPEPERVVEIFETGDRVSHDIHGLGSVVAVDSYGVSVDFGAQTLRITSPFAKMEKL